MKRIPIIVTAVVLTVLVSSFMLNASDRRVAIENALGAQTYFNCGIDKLDRVERDNLFSLIGSLPVVSYTQSAAEAYLAKQGWTPVHVLGAVVVDTVWDEKHLVVMDEYDLFLLDPIIARHLPDPGIYLAKRLGSSWTLLFPDGTDGSFSATELE